MASSTHRNLRRRLPKQSFERVRASEGTAVAQSPFSAYARAGFLADLLPILPPDAAVSRSSPSYDDLIKSRGKVTGHKIGDEWVGLPGWSTRQTTAEELDAWTGSGAGIGMQGRNFPAVDVDIDDARIADAVIERVLSILGPAPRRTSRLGRGLLPYCCPGIPKRRLAFHLPAGFEGAPDGKPGCHEGDADHGGAKPRPVFAVEIIGHGFQYVCEGIHPKTLKPYGWTDGRSPAEWGAGNLTEITAAKVEELLTELEAMLVGDFGAVIVSSTSAGGGASERAGVWQGGLIAPTTAAIIEALAVIPNEGSYDDWLRMLAAVKAASGGDEEAFDALLTWSMLWAENTPEQVRSKWEGLRPPFAVGWNYISQLARAQGMNTAAYDFDDYVPDPNAEAGPALDAKERMFRSFAWCEPMGKAIEIATGDRLDRQQFNARHYKVGNPNSHMKGAWAVFMEEGDRRETVRGVTFRPGGPPRIMETLPGLTGMCINTWRPGPPLDPTPVTDDEVRRYIELAEDLFPDAGEREIVLNKLAWDAQFPGLKSNWALVLGSDVQGVGKDLLLKPYFAAIGPEYVSTLRADDLDSRFTSRFQGVKVVYVTEMRTFGHGEMANRLKPLIASPPDTITIERKGENSFAVPNIIAMVFATNDRNALKLGRNERRYFVTWRPGAPLSEAFYGDLRRWLDSGGADLAGRWLMQRDVSDFNAQGRAPDSPAKEAMRRESLSSLGTWVEDSIVDGEGPFSADLVILQDLVGRLPDYVRMPNGRRVTPEDMSRALEGAECKYIGRPTLDPRPAGALVARQGRIWSVRRHPMYADLPSKELVRLLWEQWSASRGGHGKYNDPNSWPFSEGKETPSARPASAAEARPAPDQQGAA